MATQAKQILYSPVDLDDAQYSDYTPQMTEDELEFEKFKEEFKQSNEYAKVTCYRQPTTRDGRPGQKQLTYLFEAGVDEYTFSQLAGRLRDEYGSGVYRIQMRDKDNKLKMNRGVSIEAPTIESDSKNPNGGVPEIIAQMRETMSEQQRMLSQYMHNPANDRNPIDQMTQMMAAMGGMMQAMGIQQQAPTPPKTLIETLTEFKLMKELLGDISGDGMAGEANLYSLLGETMRAFGGPIAAALASGAQSGAINSQGTAVQKQLPQPEPQKENDAETIAMNNQEMKKNVAILLHNAKAKTDPKLMAELLVEHTPDDKEDELWDFISADDCLSNIYKLEPATLEYKPWFEALRDNVIKLLSDDDDSDDSPEGLPSEENADSIADSETVAGAENDVTPDDAGDESDPTEHS